MPCILFGIVLALIAVSVYENFQRVNAVVLAVLNALMILISLVRRRACVS